MVVKIGILDYKQFKFIGFLFCRTKKCFKSGIFEKQVYYLKFEFQKKRHKEIKSRSQTAFDRMGPPLKAHCLKTYASKIVFQNDLKCCFGDRYVQRLGMCVCVCV